MAKRYNPRLRVAQRVAERRGFTLLELTVVIALVGIIALVAVARLGTSALGNMGARGLARQVALDMRHARRAAIATGDNHYLQLTGNPVSSYTIYRRTGSGSVQVEKVREFPAGVTVFSADTTIEFTFEGTALDSYVVTVSGPDRTYNVSVYPAAGTPIVAEVP